MKSEEVIIARADVKELYNEVLSKGNKSKQEIILLIINTFLLASGCENLCISDKDNMDVSEQNQNKSA